jgi:hypothetical protein
MRNDLLLGGGFGGVGGPLGAEWRATHDMTRGPLSATHLTDRTPEEIRRLAGARGYEPHGLPDAEGNLRKFRDPVTKLPRLRIDQGHVDPVTGAPYNNPRAAVPHAHGYDDSGAPIRDPATGDKHFPFR